MLVHKKGSLGAAKEGAYEASDVLGQGSFGTVYLGEDLQHPGRKVALKSVSVKPGPGRPGSWDEAVAEAETLQKLRHPHVLRCYECFEEPVQQADRSGRRIWIVMEYMDGGDLNSLYNARRRAFAGPLEAPFVRRLITSIGGALKYVHGMGIIHRDVKCMNVLLSKDFDKMVLADFGLSCAANERQPANAGQALGTPTYMSPEVLCGQPHSVASDSWSLGVCAFKIAALERPFTARDDLTLTMRIVRDQPKDLPAGCAADVANAVAGLLSKDADKRMCPEEAMVWTRDAPIARLSSMAAVPQPPRLSCL